jgi:hypothetical protein
MRKFMSVLVGGCILAGSVMVQSGVAHAGSAIRGKTQGHCTLTNVDYGRDMYNSTCKISEKIDGNSILFKIIMGNAEPFLFASGDGGNTWMHGPERVRFSDYGHSATFRWGTFRLEVEEY